MRKRAIADIDTALRLYYEKDELDNKDITTLFNGIAPSTVCSMKKEVLAKMDEKKIPRFRYHTVNTEVAYEVWGIDVENLEKRRAKLIKLGLLQTNS